MIQFLRLHARDLDFHATVIKARQFAEATGQSKPNKKGKLHQYPPEESRTGRVGTPFARV